MQKARRFFKSGAPFVFCRKFNGSAESPARPEFFPLLTGRRTSNRIAKRSDSPAVARAAHARRGRKGIDFRLIQIVKEPPHAFFGTMQQQYAGRGGDESEAAKRLVAREKSKFDARHKFGETFLQFEVSILVALQPIHKNCLPAFARLKLGKEPLFDGCLVEHKDGDRADGGAYASLQEVDGEQACNCRLRAVEQRLVGEISRHHE